MQIKPADDSRARTRVSWCPKGVWNWLGLFVLYNLILSSRLTYFKSLVNLFPVRTVSVYMKVKKETCMQWIINVLGRNFEQSRWNCPKFPNKYTLPASHDLKDVVFVVLETDVSPLSEYIEVLFAVQKV